mgnify:CR=1 FL=1|jgi:hypothetical protein|tara:strand:+ start:216 stop:1064 length:849 start_codon:yes stop_codon:yes gene_type:complete
MAAFTAIAAGVGAATSLIGGAVGANQAKKAAGRAQRNKLNAERELANIKASRATIINPYSGTKNLSGLASDLSSQISNPFANLGVATSAAEIQIEEADIALANTLDTLRATGASAGGATALAQAALQSKKGVSASIEQQEAQNEKMKAEGEQNLNQQKISEQQRLQSIAISEGQRVQSNDAAGKQFEFQTKENRTNMDLNRAAGQIAQASQSEADANAAQASAIGGAVSALGGIAGAVAGSGGKSNAGSGGKKSYKSWAGSQDILSGADISRKAYRGYKKTL